MTVHCLQLTVAPVDPDGDPVDLQAKKDQIQNWVDDHQEVLQPLASGFFTTLDDESLDLDYARGSWRFDLAEDPAGMKDEIASWLDSNFQWWAVAYHQCDHDSLEDGCTWDQEYTSSTTPPSKILELA